MLIVILFSARNSSTKYGEQTQWQQPHPCSDCLLNCSNPTQTKFQQLATSQTVILLYSRTRSYTQSTISLVLLVNGHTEHSASIDVTTLLNLENHLKLRFFPLSALQKLLLTLISFHSIFIQIKENLMQSYWSFKSVIF